MRLMIVGINYAPEIIATGVYTTGLAEFMAQEGVETDVVTAHPYYPAWRTFEGWRRPWWTRRQENDVNIVHCPIYVPANPTGLRRILHYISFAATSLPILLWKALVRRPDIVVVIAPSIMIAPGALAATRLSGASAWLHVQDYEVEAAFATGLLKEDSRIGRAAKAFEAWVLRRFDRASSISAPMLRKLREKGVEEARIMELRNWANIKKVKPLTGPSPLKAELGIETEHVALYSGNLANKQGLEVLPEMARQLAHRKDLTIAICGDGPMRETLQELAADVPMIRFFPLQPIDRLSDLLGMADVHLLPQIAGAEELVLPSKLTNMLASGRPVLATTSPETALGQEVEGAGVLVPAGDASAMAAALDGLLSAPEKRAELGRVARERALKRWDMTAILSRLKKQFELEIASSTLGARNVDTK
ncbi:WcaI family glycosyltransferase [Phaeobacter sp. B1627]|uniref:WcaI family glycosyltransferase n=1 Tax=Phaeobacter sp. B1627 TaxID=2583809 RepID=UPI002104EC88|nr:WcaI family glycosyltransferase [Phaeobacter sp. B1627]